MTAPARHRSLKHSLQQALMALLVVVWPFAAFGFIYPLGITTHVQHTSRDVVKRDLQNLDDAMKVYAAKTGLTPETGNAMNALVGAHVIAQPAVDPWGHEYIYVKEGTLPVFISYGRDGAPGGSGDDADLSSKDLE